MTSTLKVAAIYLLSLMLVACGGGGSLSNDGGGNPTPSTYSISFSVVDEQGGAVDHVNGELSASAPWTVQAKVTKDGSAQSGVTVTFTLADGEVASLSKGSDTTNSDGVAEVQVLAGGKKGSVVLSARLTDNTEATISFDSAGDGSVDNRQPASLELFSDTSLLPSSGSDEIEIFALVKDKDNILMPDVSVNFSADSFAELRVTQAVTAEDGRARATLTTSNAENRTIKVTVNAGGLAQELLVSVAGTTINMNGPSSIITGAPADLTISLVDSDRKGIAGKEIILTSNTGVLSKTNPITNSSGQATVTYTAGNAGEDVITATALNASNSFNITVQEDDFEFSSLSDGTATEIKVDTPSILTIKWLKNKAPHVGGHVTFTASRGVLSSTSAVTNSLGEASVNITASSAGISSISATGVDTDGAIVTARSQIEFIATEAKSVYVDATPDSIGPDGQTSTITAVVRDPRGNLVKGKPVVFSLDDPSGGFISPGVSVTDSRGIASTVFQSNAVSSPRSVIITATVQDAPGASDFTTLTVGKRAFDISFGTGRVVEEDNNSTYKKEFAVFVSDPDGNPVPNVSLDVSITPNGKQYAKGGWQWDSVAEVWASLPAVFCNSEDTNGNGLLDLGEDLNGDGDLTPGLVGAISLAGNSTTDENGQAIIEYFYPKAYGAWVEVEITVRGQSAGSESSQSQGFQLVVAASDVSDEASPPPPNPFGRSANCSDTN